MITQITRDNIYLLKDSLLSTEIVEKEFVNNPYAKYIVYLDKDKVIGYIYYSDIYDRCEINQIEVISSKRNNGIATKLMNKLINSVNKSISLEVRIDNYIAIKLYEKFGFKNKAIRKGYYNGIDGILMVKE